MTLTTLIGVIIRIAREVDKGTKIKIARVILILFSGLALSYIITTYGTEKGWFEKTAVGVWSIISGVFAYDVIEAIIKYVPEIVRNLLNKKFEINIEKEETKDGQNQS
jgi:hypothetical protein